MNIMERIKILIQEQYGMNVMDIRCMTTGVGGDTYLIESLEGRFVFKMAESNAMNQPQTEPELCDF